MNAAEWNERELDAADEVPTKTEHAEGVALLPGVYYIVIKETGVKSIQKIGDSEHVVLKFNKPFVP